MWLISSILGNMSSFLDSVCLLIKASVLVSSLSYVFGVQGNLFLLVFQTHKVFLAIGFFVVNGQMFLTFFISIWVSIWLGIGITLLRKVILERVIVFNEIAFPLRKRCLLNSCCNCLSKMFVHCSQLTLLVFCKSILK